MGELTIQTHDFEKSKNEIQKFSKKKSEDLKLNKVATDGGFLGLGNHKVTGYELNSVTEKIQGYLIDINSMQTEFIKEFGQVYNALEALDKDYIQAILISLKAAEKANDDVKGAQKDITKTVEVQKKIIEKLSEFKDKTDGYKHLKDVDSLWETAKELQRITASAEKKLDGVKKQLSEQDKALQNGMRTLDEKVKTLQNQLQKMKQENEKQSQFIENLCRFKDEIERIEHLKDVDSLWESDKELKEHVTLIEEDADNIKENVAKVKENVATAEKKLDTVKEQLSEQKGALEKRIYGLNEKVEELQKQIPKVDEKLEELQKQIPEMDEKLEKSNLTVSKKIKVAYVLAGSSIGIAIIELVLLLLRIL